MKACSATGLSNLPSNLLPNLLPKPNTWHDFPARCLLFCRHAARYTTLVALLPAVWYHVGVCPRCLARFSDFTCTRR